MNKSTCISTNSAKTSTHTVTSNTYHRNYIAPMFTCTCLLCLNCYEIIKKFGQKSCPSFFLQWSVTYC